MDMRRLRIAFAALSVVLASLGLSLSAVASASEAKAERREVQVDHNSAMSIAGGVAGSAGAIMLAVAGSSVAARALRGVNPE